MKEEGRFSCKHFIGKGMRSRESVHLTTTQVYFPLPFLTLHILASYSGESLRVLLLPALLQCIIIRLSDLHLAEKTPPKFLLFPKFRVDFT